MSHHKDYKYATCVVCDEKFLTRYDEKACSALCKEILLDALAKAVDKDEKENN